MTLLKPVPVSTSRLSWDPVRREFSAELSDLGGRFGRVWDDSCDEGLTLVSVRTGREVVCAVDSDFRDPDSTVRWWVLKPVERGHAWSVVVFND